MQAKAFRCFNGSGGLNDDAKYLKMVSPVKPKRPPPGTDDPIQEDASAVPAVAAFQEEAFPAGRAQRAKSALKSAADKTVATTARLARSLTAKMESDKGDFSAQNGQSRTAKLARMLRDKSNMLRDKGSSLLHRSQQHRGDRAITTAIDTGVSGNGGSIGAATAEEVQRLRQDLAELRLASDQKDFTLSKLQGELFALREQQRGQAPPATTLGTRSLRQPQRQLQWEEPEVGDNGSCKPAAPTQEGNNGGCKLAAPTDEQVLAAVSAAHALLLGCVNTQLQVWQARSAEQAALKAAAVLRAFINSAAQENDDDVHHHQQGLELAGSGMDVGGVDGGCSGGGELVQTARRARSTSARGGPRTDPAAWEEEGTAGGGCTGGSLQGQQQAPAQQASSAAAAAIAAGPPPHPSTTVASAAPSLDLRYIPQLGDEEAEIIFSAGSKCILTSSMMLGPGQPAATSSARLASSSSATSSAALAASSGAGGAGQALASASVATTAAAVPGAGLVEAFVRGVTTSSEDERSPLATHQRGGALGGGIGLSCARNAVSGGHNAAADAGGSGGGGGDDSVALLARQSSLMTASGSTVGGQEHRRGGLPVELPDAAVAAAAAAAATGRAQQPSPSSVWVHWNSSSSGQSSAHTSGAAASSGSGGPCATVAIALPQAVAAGAVAAAAPTAMHRYFNASEDSQDLFAGQPITPSMP